MKSAATEKLRLDLCHRVRMCRSMPCEPDEVFQLIQQLLLEAGRIMEDSSPEFALVLPANADDLFSRLLKLEAAASDLRALASAARALHRRSLGDA